MPRITLNPKLRDFFVHMDARDAASSPGAFSRELVRHYEAGKVIILEGAPISADFDLLNRVSLPRGRKYQKETQKFFLYPKVWRPHVARTMLREFKGNPLLYLRFRREVSRVSEELNHFVRSLFPDYAFLNKRKLSWRFTPTGPEGMHIDHFGSGEDFQYVRLFMNVDLEPRIWHLSEGLDDLAARYYHSGGFYKLRKAGGNEFCRHMNPVAFGEKEIDYHVVEFGTGDMWLCDTRLVSHQIFRGNRMVGTHFAVEPQSMQDPSKRLECRVEDYHRRYGDPASLQGSAAALAGR